MPVFCTSRIFSGYNATGLQDFDPFDYSQVPDEDKGTPAFLKYHTQQLQQCGVRPGGFKVHDLHEETLYHIEVDGKKYGGGVDGGLTPHSIMPSSAGSMWRIGFEHKQSTLDRDAYHTRNNLTQVCDERKLEQGLSVVVQVASHWFCRVGQFLQKTNLWRGPGPGCLLSHSCICHVSVPTELGSVRWRTTSFATAKGGAPVGVSGLSPKTGTKQT